jgi:hypothetical protein
MTGIFLVAGISQGMYDLSAAQLELNRFGVCQPIFLEAGVLHSFINISSIV